MGTQQNTDLLREEGYPLPDGITRNDLMIALECDTEEALKAAVDAGMDALAGGRGGRHVRRTAVVVKLRTILYNRLIEYVILRQVCR